MTYRFYLSRVTEDGPKPVGEVEATLILKASGEPQWKDVSKHFEALCLPWFEDTTRFDVADSVEQLEPYSEAALDYLYNVKLPSLGYVAVKADP